MQLEIITQTQRRAERLLTRFKRPAILFSGGKDSLAMVALFRHLDLPVLVMRPAHVNPTQWAFAERIIREWDLRATYLPPSAVALKLRNEVLHLVSTYNVGGGEPAAFIGWEQNLINEPGPRQMCGLEDVLKQPHGEITGPWDVLLSGQKIGDSDLAGGVLDVPADLANLVNGPAILYPLRVWTDSAVWDYLEQSQIPLDLQRYSRELRKERADKTASNDHVNACTACLDRRNPAPTVFCPKARATISNIATVVPYLE